MNRRHRLAALERRVPPHREVCAACGNPRDLTLEEAIRWSQARRRANAPPPTCTHAVYRHDALPSLLRATVRPRRAS